MVHVEVVAGSNSANAVEAIFCALSTRQRLNGDVGVGKNAVDRVRYRGYQLLGTLEGNGTGEADSKIGEITVARATDSHSSNFEHAIHVRDGIGDLDSDPSGSGIEQRVDGAPRQAPTHGNNDPGDEQC